MTGHVRRRGERSWELKYDVGADATGRRKTRYASFKGTKRDAEIELAKLVTASAQGEQVDPSKVTVAEFLDRWERDWATSNVSPKTLERYIELMRMHVRPRIGAVRLQKLKLADLSELYATLQREGRGPKRGLAARTVGHVHRVLHGALARAVDWGVVQQNVASRVTPPRVPDQEVEILTADQVHAVLKTARGKPIFQIAALALASGMRRGELLATRWQDIDLDAAKITIARSLEQTKAGGLRFKLPKTKHGRRTISLPLSAVTELKVHRRAQQELRLALGGGKLPTSALLFADIDGQPRKPNAVTKDWERIATAAGVAFANLHTLRHTHASHLIANGLDVLTISRRLGHSTPTITLAIYGHLFPQTDDRAAQIMEAAFLAAGTD
jgi:integrase